MMCRIMLVCNRLFLIIFIVAFLKEVRTLPNVPNQEYCPIQYNDGKLCLLRTNYHDRSSWNHYAGEKCYSYTNKVRFKEKYNIVRKYNFTCNETGIIQLPVAVVDFNTIALFDYTDSESTDLLKKSFKTQELFNNYIKCCKEAEKCCTTSMTNENIKSSAEYCPLVWDGWSCFPRTQANTEQKLPCSSQAYQSPEKVCTLESSKQCTYNDQLKLAIWKEQTDYTTCAISPVFLRRYNYYVPALYVCIVCSLPAIIIFLSIPTFRETTRVILHRNLLIAIVIRNVLTIIAKKLVIIDALVPLNETKRVMERNPIECRILAFLAGAATNSIYACMLVDGYYLHKVIVRTFAKEPSCVTIYIVVTVLTFLPSLIWVSIVAINDRASCWMVDSDGEQWSVDSFRMAVLTINFFLLLDIIRVMVSKMKQGGTTRQTKAAFRATLFLIPLFGLHIFITAMKIVVNDTCLAEDIYDYFRYTMEASQGIFVAILFCYANTEVHNELKNAFRKIAIHLNQRYGWEINLKERRRTMSATYVRPGTVEIKT